MKKLFLIMALGLAVASCNNESDAADDAKDSVDSAASEQMDRVDSTADMKKDQIDSAAEMKKDQIEKVDSAAHKAEKH